MKTEADCIHCSLTFAVLNKDIGKVKSIIKSDIDLNEQTECNNALDSAIRENNSEIIKLLISKGANLNLRIDLNKLPIVQAIECGNRELINLLLSLGATLNDIPIAEFAGRNDDTELFELLLEIGFNINLIDAQTGRNSLHFASMYGYEQLSNLLLKNEINFELKDNWGHTALDLAKTNGHIDTIAIIEKNKAANKV